MIHIDIITVLPEMVEDALNHSIMRRAKDHGIAQINVVNLRDYTLDRHNTTDDTPVGGGGGMLMMVQPIADALEALQSEEEGGTCRVILTDPAGKTCDQKMAREFAAEDKLIILCGHYEGVDERVREHLVTDEVSIGDFVLTGGELPALMMVDAIVRLQVGALGDEGATLKDSFSEELLEYPQYTKPQSIRGWDVPEILLSGHHAKINAWRRKQQIKRTRERRPDLWAKFVPSKTDLRLIAELDAEM